MTRIPIDDENDAQPGPDADDAQAAQTPGDEDTVRETTRGVGAASAGGGDAQRLQAERDDLYQRLARATADFKNTQKRIQGEADQRVQYANQSLIKSLLPVIDNFERALAQDVAKVDPATILRGMQIVHDE